MRRVLITGAGRGLGLEFVKQCLNRGDQVFAGVRSPQQSPELQALLADYPHTLTLLKLEVTDPASREECYRVVSGLVNGLDLLVNNAGVNSKSPGVGDFATHFRLEDLDAENVLKMFRINSLGPIMMVQQFLGLLKAGQQAKVVNISSWLGSLTGKTGGGNYSYCASKTALNMLTRAMAFDVLEHGIIAIMVNPGWVQTDMGGPHAQLTPTQSVEGILAVADKATPADAGGFFDWNGETHPW